MGVSRPLRHVEDLPVGPSWTAALNFLTLLLAAATILVLLSFSRNALAYLTSAEPVVTGHGDIRVTLAGQDMAVPRGMLRFPPPALLERDPGLPYGHVELDLGGGVIATVSPRKELFTPAGRLDNLYAPSMTSAVTDAPAGLTGRLMAPSSVYAGDTFYLAEEAVAGETYYLRCTHDKALAACYRTRPLGNGLSLDYRFPAERLTDWRAIENHAAQALAAALGR